MKTHNQLTSVQFAAAEAGASIPAAGAGASLSTLRSGAVSPKYQRVRLDHESGVAVLTGPVEFGGEINGKIYKLGELNGGADITLTTGKGYAEIVQFLGTYDRFWLVPTGQTGAYDGFIEGVETSC